MLRLLNPMFSPTVEKPSTTSAQVLKTSTVVTPQSDVLRQTIEATPIVTIEETPTIINNSYYDLVSPETNNDPSPGSTFGPKTTSDDPRPASINPTIRSQGAPKYPPSTSTLLASVSLHD